MAQKVESVSRENILFLTKILKSPKIWKACQTGVVLVMAFLIGSAYAGPNELGQICDQCLR